MNRTDRTHDPAKAYVVPDRGSLKGEGESPEIMPGPVEVIAGQNERWVETPAPVQPRFHRPPHPHYPRPPVNAPGRQPYPFPAAGGPPVPVPAAGPMYPQVLPGQAPPQYPPHPQYAPDYPVQHAVYPPQVQSTLPPQAVSGFPSTAAPPPRHRPRPAPNSGGEMVFYVPLANGRAYPIVVPIADAVVTPSRHLFVFRDLDDSRPLPELFLTDPQARIPVQVLVQKPNARVFEGYVHNMGVMCPQYRGQEVTVMFIAEVNDVAPVQTQMHESPGPDVGPDQGEGALPYGDEYADASAQYGGFTQ